MADQLKYVNKLQGTRVLVIGGTSGIGFTTAEAVLESGAAALVLSSSNPQKIQDAIKRLQNSYPALSSKCQITGHAADLGTEATLEENIKSLLEFATEGKAKKLDHIVYTAGDQLAILKLPDADIAKIKQAGMVRFFGPLLLGKHAPPYLTPGPRSSLTLTTGSASQRPLPDWTVVVSFATGLQGMARGMALDLKPIRVNLVSPGAVDTEMWDHLGAEQRTAVKEQTAGRLPLGRMGRPQDVAEAYLYCMRDENVTGTMVSTNGGALLV